jgi:NADPH-dependent curcumin reductase CurA
LAGQTAWTSFYGLVKPHVSPDGTIWVNAASGTVGELVVQLAKREGLRVIASAGDDEKVKYVREELGADEVFNYKTESPCVAIPRLAPDELDLVYENVGCEHFQAAVDSVKPWGHIVVCGMVAEYNKDTHASVPGLTSLANILGRGSRYAGSSFGTRISIRRRSTSFGRQCRA